MRSRMSHVAKAIALAFSITAATVAGGDISPSFAVPRHPCASGEHDRLVNPTIGETISRFGLRHDPLTGKVTWHTGIDYLVKPGALLRAGGLGRVSKVGGDAPDALFIAVNYGHGIEVLYKHLGHTGPIMGRCVRRGDILGEAGRQKPLRGGQILHIEVRRNGVLIDPSGILQPHSRPLP